jgi:hypothetical protein
MRSAGLSAVGTCRMSEMLDLVCILAIRFTTNVFKIRGEDMIYWSTIVELVQYTIREILIVRAF